MDRVEVRQIVQAEKAVGETYNQEIRGGVESSTVNLGIVLHEVILFDNPPTSFGNIFHRIRIFLSHVLPPEKSSIRTDCVDLGRCQQGKL